MTQFVSVRSSLNSSTFLTEVASYRLTERTSPSFPSLSPVECVSVCVSLITKEVYGRDRDVVFHTDIHKGLCMKKRKKEVNFYERFNCHFCHFQRHEERRKVFNPKC